ncbi:DUF6587 family protein [Gallaecimonas mangrovi]|uniref:DUF6587 family protein n=1 Tax=Gallaecimonas mangrovi TaxID=2291597 RepID=UPI000E204A21|nr:DUF6587 family protein [Gallaecimonas mangrovi]
MMFDVIQAVIVTLVVITALVMALKKYVPAVKRWQGNLADKLLKSHGRFAHWLGLKLHRQLSAAGGCGSDDGCGTCGGCSAPAAPAEKSHGVEIFRTRA